jgi:hypothetical protein
MGTHTGLLPHYQAVIDANMTLDDSSMQPQQAAPADGDNGDGTAGDARTERTARG